MERRKPRSSDLFFYSSSFLALQSGLAYHDSHVADIDSPVESLAASPALEQPAFEATTLVEGSESFNAKSLFTEPRMCKLGSPSSSTSDEHSQRKFCNKGNLDALSSQLARAVRSVLSPKGKLAGLYDLQKDMNTMFRRRPLELSSWASLLEPAVSMSLCLRRFAPLRNPLLGTAKQFEILTELIPDMHSEVQAYSSQYRTMLTETQRRIRDTGCKLKVGTKSVDIRRVIMDGYDGLLDLCKRLKGFAYPFDYQEVVIDGADVELVAGAISSMLSMLRGAAGPNVDSANDIDFWDVMDYTNPDIWVDDCVYDAEVVARIRETLEQEEQGQRLFGMLRKVKGMTDLRF